MENGEIGNRVESDNRWYCKYCRKYYSMRYVKRHNNSDMHKYEKLFYKDKSINYQISYHLLENFNKGHYDPNDVNLVGEERKKRFEQLQLESWKKLDKARLDGYFDKYDTDEEIDMVEYDIYHKLGIKLDARKEVFSDDDSDGDDE